VRVMTKVGRKPFIDRSYAEDEYVKAWLVGLAEKTKDGYVKSFHEWLTFIEMTPKEQISMRARHMASSDLRERQHFENKFREYKAYLESKGNLTPESIKTMLKVVASFGAIYYIYGNRPGSEPNSEMNKVVLRTSMGDITIQLYEDMPITTGNFRNLVKQGVYDDTIFQSCF
jgi:hypothetical protein